MAPTLEKGKGGGSKERGTRAREKEKKGIFKIKYICRGERGNLRYSVKRGAQAR